MGRPGIAVSRTPRVPYHPPLVNETKRRPLTRPVGVRNHCRNLEPRSGSDRANEPSCAATRRLFAERFPTLANELVGDLADKERVPLIE